MTLIHMPVRFYLVLPFHVRWLLHASFSRCVPLTEFLRICFLRVCHAWNLEEHSRVHSKDVQE
jgi:hypothetical protein